MAKKKKGAKGAKPLRLHLKAWRKFRSLSQEQLAQLIGTTPATISRIENGKQNWDQAFLTEAAHALGCAPVDLIMSDPNEAPGMWRLWDSLDTTQRQQAVAVVEALKKTGTHG